MNKYICVRELIFRLFRDVSLGHLCANSLVARATTTSKNLTLAPWGCKIACKRVFFFDHGKAGYLTYLGSPPPPWKQALETRLSHDESFANRLQVRRVNFAYDESSRPLRIVSIRQHWIPEFNACLCESTSGDRSTLLMTSRVDPCESCHICWIVCCSLLHRWQKSSDITLAVLSLSLV